MLQSKMKWNFPETITRPVDFDIGNFSPLISELLMQRGIKSNEDAKKFLSPDLAQLYNVEWLSDIQKATNRIHRAIEVEEKILVYGDYDADGVSSTTIMMETLQNLGADCDYYIPNRFTEGYGPNEAAFRAAYENGFRLIVTVDTGIASVHEAEVAKRLGIDLIITDHHEVQAELPDAYAIVHPKCSPDYPFKELAGAGVALKFSESLLGYFPKQLLDLAAIGTIADLVPLLGENRIIAHYGLQKLTTTSRPGIIAIKNESGIQGHVTEDDVGFSIGPRLNAVGRLQDADLAVQLLMADDTDDAARIAGMVEEINLERKSIVSEIVKEAENMASPVNDQGVIVVAKEGWNQGVLGIVASNLVRKYDRPAIVLSIFPENGEVKGSARSIPAFDLFSACMEIRDIFTHFGGHAQAAGMTLPLSNVQTLKQELNAMIFQQLSKADFAQVVEISKTITVPEINEELITEISQLAPFGMANPKPVFHVKAIPSSVRQIGNGKKHLKLQFQKDNYKLDGIGFGLGNLYQQLSRQTPLSVVGELNINEWNGFRKVQMVIQDMKIDEWQLFDHRGMKGFDITPYVQQDTGYAAVFQQLPDANQLPGNVVCVTYDTDVSSLEGIHTLFLYDFPPSLTVMENLVKNLKPDNIHVCFYLQDSTFMKAFPAREDFKWLYGLLAKRQTIHLQKELPMVMDAKGWTKDRILFMSSVFFELDFVKIEEGTMKLNANPLKKDLSESAKYQERLNRVEIEKTLYYSTYNELKTWFSNCLECRLEPEEEID
ncbi:single-stranded-DNA-specific exonuclease RecJ [Lentibacillus cibarius]|uniref:Single-stranded-DNA-specific exonuclease RecJ n=1 Tax=Lentibacillus cibarius TaxID=2583219 RepID=A0A549YLP8_9BACI|nr:single-stranded-DNA-specific exonuclease RecJ [Lentibacillus cibarius]TRM12806.1 single-stranded-DNA-specific exonuclease RecJ [Lentibacillus cibarius]